MKKLFLLMGLLVFAAVNFTACSDDDDEEKDNEKGTVYGPWQVLNLNVDGLARYFVFDVNGEMKCIDATYGEGNKLVDVQVTDGFFKIKDDQLSTTLFGGQTFDLYVDKHSLGLKNKTYDISCTKVPQTIIDELLKWKPTGMADLFGDAWFFGAEDFGSSTLYTYYVYEETGTCREYLVWFDNGEFDNCEYKDYNWKIEAGKYYKKETKSSDWGVGQDCMVTATTLTLDGEQVAKRIKITSTLSGYFKNATPAI